jgi:phospholipase/carboxylesterase
MALALALGAPGKVAGAVVMSGRLLAAPTKDRAAQKRLRGLPLLVIHGTEDPIIAVAQARAIRDALAPLPVALEYRELPIAHRITPESLAIVDAWLRARLAAK